MLANGTNDFDEFSRLLEKSRAHKYIQTYNGENRTNLIEASETTDKKITLIRIILAG